MSAILINLKIYLGFVFIFFILVKINLKQVIIVKRTVKVGFNFVLKVSFHRVNKLRRKYSTYIYYIYMEVLRGKSEPSVHTGLKI